MLLSKIALATILAILVQYVVGNQRIVHVNGNYTTGEDDDSLKCYAHGNCFCNSLDHVLANLTSDVLINITTDVTLSSIINVSDIENVTIIGHNNPTVNYCTNASIQLTSCHNCIIQGITWDGCGTDESINYTEPALMSNSSTEIISEPALNLSYSSNVTIQNCSFQHSVGQAIVLSEVSDVKISNCKFINNSYYRGHGAAIHYSSNNRTRISSHLVLKINNCIFSYNKMNSLVYLENRLLRYNTINFINVMFFNNHGTSVYAINHKMYFNGKVLFQNNIAESGTGIYVTHSTVIFSKNSNMTFLQNSASHSGAAVLVRNHSSIIFDQNTVAKFVNNKAAYGTIYSDNSNVTFKGTCQVTFSSNTATRRGAAIYSDNSNITFTENADVQFNSHDNEYSGIIYGANFSKLTFEGNSNTSFINNSGGSWGRTIYFYDHGYISFEGSSRTTFRNNTGGAIFYYSYYGYGYISFKDNSTTMFINNAAEYYGGAISGSGYISFDGNSNVIFTGNKATYDGGAIDIYRGSISFEGNSTAVFNSNNAYFGGAINTGWRGELFFKGNACAVFTDNTASYGGAIYTSQKSNVSINRNSSVSFIDNMADYGGAIYSGSISFNGNSNTLFRDNEASNNGGALYIRTKLTFDDDSTVNFTNNKAEIGEGILSSGESKIVLIKSATVIFNDSTEYWCNYHNACLEHSDTTDQVHRDVNVTIDNNGEVKCTSENAFKTFSKKCGHKYLEDMLVNHTSNKQVIISDEVIISSVIILTKLSNVSIIGNMNHSIVCINNAGLQVEQCSNVTIEGMNLTECGAHDIPVINITSSSDVKIQNCHFQQSKGQAVVMSESSGVNITHCKFISNTGYRDHGAAIHCSSNNSVNKTDGANFSLSNSIFHNNHGVSVYLTNCVLYINGEVSFEHNTADNGAGLYISNFSQVLFGEKSNVKFTNNSANHMYHITSGHGAAIFLNGHSSVLFDQNCIVKFTDNEATTGIIYSEANSNVTFQGTSKVTFSSNSATQYGAAIYSYNSSHVTFTGNSNITFNNIIAAQLRYLNSGGIVHSEYNSSVSFEENSQVLFCNNTGFNGGAMSALYNSFIVFKDNTTVTFNNNTAHESGGAVFFNQATVVIKGNSNLTFCNNKAHHGGAVAAVYCKGHQILMFSGNSNVTFSNNEAKNGGAVHAFSIHKMIFTDNSTLEFKNNIADAGGVFYLANTALTFNETAKVTYNDNTARRNGGVIYSINSFLLFNESSYLRIEHNKAMLNGGVMYCANSEVSFLKLTTIYFSNNEAIDGGVIFANNNSKFSFDGHASIGFCNNIARSNGGVGYFSDDCIITLKEDTNLTFKDNKAVSGGAICLNNNTSITFAKNSTALFKNNVAINDGGAINILKSSSIKVECNTTIIFTANKAQYGGAMYFDDTDTTLTVANNNSNVRFDINTARFAGDDMYFDAVGSSGNCLSSRIYNITNGTKRFISTPPSILRFSAPARCIINDTETAECKAYFLRHMMLGEEIEIPVCVLNYCNQKSLATQFRLVNEENNQTYSISGSEQILLSCDTFKGISIIGKTSVPNPSNYTINVTLHDDRNSDWKQVSVNLTLELTSCHDGFWQNLGSEKCECYNASDIVSCSGSSSTIKRGYWFGSVTSKPTVTFCPINYCNFTCCETSNGYYHLSPVRDDNQQCMSHRTGTACGSCTDGYTLSFDSPECVNIDSCTAAHTVLVILLMMIYWILIILLVFALMHYKVGIGYLYSITYYYSIIDILLNRSLQASRRLYITVNIISSFSKITPQLLGELCFATGMSGIDQQFIHYIHPLAVVLILVVIILLARKFQRIAENISRGIIHVICLLLLLSYTSIASTSLMLMRTLKFRDIDNVYTYLSPDIEYFHDRHLAYGLVALLCTVTIVPGLPLFLILEPFLSRWFNFTKIKPLLDQFRGCYKDKYRCFAGYYMICRLVIITLIIIASSSNDYVANYLLITTCGIIGLIHLTVKPYSKEILNKLDGITLHLITFVAALRLLDDFDSPFVITLAVVLFILPLLNFMALALFLNKDGLKKLVKNAKQFKLKYISPNSSTESDAKNKNEVPMKEFEIIVDEDMRNAVTSYDIM